ncbi:MAG: replicative DNA helicase [Deltaproteobacteria bacterium]|nr:replicative DNA helicase [Deltaproteobacteria bacterium]
MDKSSGRVPPHNLEAEQSVLGGILLDNRAINRIIELLNVEDFYREAHKKIFQAMINISERGGPIDLITLSNELDQKKLLDDVGGAAYLSLIADVVPTAANIDYYAKIVKEKAILRQLIATATDIVARGYQETENVELFLDEAEKAIFHLAENKITPSFYSMKDIIEDSFLAIEELYKNKDLITGVSTGFKELDILTSGFQPSDLIIVAGRPSMGKTAFALNIAAHASLKKNIPTSIFSLEMSRKQLAIRMLCSEAEIDMKKVRSGFLSKKDWPRLTSTAGKLAQAPIFIDDTPALSVLELRAKARRLKSEHNIGLLIVDYLQLMRTQGGAERREQEIAEISRSLKALAKELNIPVVAISQLSRRTEYRPKQRPQMADLRESGAIEQDADLILFIYREEVYQPTEENRGIAEVIIGKQRNGPTGNIRLTFLAKYTKFENLAYHVEEYEEYMNI